MKASPAAALALATFVVLACGALLLAWRVRGGNLPRAAAFVPAALIGAALLWVMALRGLSFWHNADQAGGDPGASKPRG